jgi:3-oxoacyl-ACP reductase-like protein
MSIFGSIVSAIFGHKSASATTPSAPAGPAAPVSAPAGPPATSAAAPPTPTGAATPKPISQAEVVAMIEKAVGAQGEDLNWKQSIVDLMKALKLDSSLAARKQLAQELGYTGALDGSAEMNIWLHKQVMAKLAEGGGTVPASLKVA